MKSPHRRTWRLAAVLLAAALLLAGCGSRGGSPAGQGEGQPAEAKPTVVRLAITGDEGALNPYTYVTGYPGHNLLLLVYDTLFQLDERNVPQPWLVEEYQVDPSGQVWSFTLRQGITWHDGKPLTAEDVRFSIQYYKDHKHSRFTRAVSAIESVEVQDDRRFTIRLSKPVPSFALSTLADVPILPKHIWEGVSDPSSFQDSTGSGPFKLVEHVPDRSYRLVANEAYFRGKPAVDEIHISVIEDQTATFTALKVGEIDAASRPLAPELAAEFKSLPDVKVVSGPGFASTLLQINHEREPFDDVRARQALALAIDPAELVEVVLLGYGTPGSPGFIHPALPFYNPSVTHQTDRQRARELWAQVGYTGKPFELLVYSDNPIRVRTAEIIAGWLKEIGMEVSVKALDSTTVDSLVWPDYDVTKGRKYDLAIWGWSAPVMLDPARLGTLFHSDLANAGFLNIGAFKDPQVDPILDQLAVTVDEGKQRELLAQVQARVAETVPFVTLYYQDGIYAYRPGAYDGWVYMNGQGILHKLSFVR